MQWVDKKSTWGLKHWGSRFRLTTGSGHLLMHLSAQWSCILGWAELSKKRDEAPFVTENLGPAPVGPYLKTSLKINLEVDSDDVQELLNSHYQELTVHKLIEIHEQDIENSIQSEDRMTVGNLTKGLSLIEKGSADLSSFRAVDAEDLQATLALKDGNILP
ncbi:hypothetical protein TNCV_1530971 [Trichonephila clavipes]|nr:hypothetical protein TNCV_1530971 [Trichonephila clavipes]